MEKYFSITDEFIGDATQEYENLVTDIGGILTNMYNDLCALCTKTKHEAMRLAINSTINAFYDDIYKEAGMIFSNWKDGENSFAARTRRLGNSEDAINRARGLDTNIESKFNELWVNNYFGSDITDKMDETEVTPENAEELKNIYEKYAGQLEEKANDALQKVGQLADDNPTFESLSEPMLALTGVVIGAFQGFVGKMDEFKNKTEELLGVQKQKGEESFSNAQTTAEQNVETIAGMVNIYGGGID